MSWEDLTDDPDAGSSNEHEKTEGAKPLSRGTGRSNVQLIVLTPRGRLLHAMTGYLAPKELLWELEQALRSWEAVKKAAASAELSVQMRVLAERQDPIHAAWRRRFAAAAGNAWIADRAADDREIVRAHPLAHAGTLTTRMFTGGRANRFGYSSDDGTAAREATRRLREKLDGPVPRETARERRLRERRAGAERGAGGAAAPVTPPAPAARPAPPRPLPPRPAPPRSAPPRSGAGNPLAR